jgi:hypothetical protein
MPDLLNPNIPAPVAEAVTGASISSQRNWQKRELLLAEAFIPPPKAGHPRLYPRLALYELAMLQAGTEAGFPLELIARAFMSRVEAVGHRIMARRGVRGYWEGDVIEAAATELPEFSSSAEPWVWVVRPGSHPADFVTAMPAANLGTIQADQSGGFLFLVIDVTAVVRKVDAAIVKSGASA